MAAYFQIDSYAPVEEEPVEESDQLPQGGVSPADVGLPEGDQSIIPNPPETEETAP
jgi:hypothetical protein